MTSPPVQPEETAVRSLSLMGVEYLHWSFPNGDDLYVTPHGRDLGDLLDPRQYWLDKSWFLSNHHRLSGTSMCYKIRTRPVGGRQIDLMLKWNRMGQDVPGATLTQNLDDAEFNSPFEEFALVEELRSAGRRAPRRILTHKPLAIYVPQGHVEPERLGRKSYKLEALAERHVEMEFDVNRNYAVIYEWVKGLDAAQALESGAMDEADVHRLHDRIREEMRAAGFEVRDHKIQHMIVRPDGHGRALRDRDGNVVCALIDFELLTRTAEREQAVRRHRRKRYLVRQVHRFEEREPCPPHLHRVEILGVDYVFGHIESTGGALWVVGKDPALFEYFLPEKWRRTPRTRLSLANQIYETFTKDNIHLVWKVSRVGELPDMDPFKADEARIIEHGYNSPFEEIAMNLRLGRKGIPTTYPRAIYMTGSQTETPAHLADPRRYETHASLRTPDGQPILHPRRDYMIIWGYWNGPDELLAVVDRDHFRGVNALQAFRQGLIERPTYLQVMERTRQRLAAIGVEDLNLRGTHILLSIDAEDRLVTDAEGVPSMRICNFELLRRIAKDEVLPTAK